MVALTYTRRSRCFYPCSMLSVHGHRHETDSSAMVRVLCAQPPQAMANLEANGRASNRAQTLQSLTVVSALSQQLVAGNQAAFEHSCTASASVANNAQETLRQLQVQTKETLAELHNTTKDVTTKMLDAITQEHKDLMAMKAEADEKVLGLMDSMRSVLMATHNNLLTMTLPTGDGGITRDSSGESDAVVQWC